MGRTVNKAPKTTLKANNSRPSVIADFSHGFTLVEILIVLAIIALVTSMGIPAIQRVTYTRLNSTTRKFVGLIRTVRNDAVLLNGIYRIAFDLDKNAWWVESQKSFELLVQATPEDEKKKKKDKEKKSDSKTPSGNFSYADKYTTKPTNLPGGIVFNGLLKESETVKKEGMAYIHFFPNGYNEQAVIYLNREGAESGGYSIVVYSTGGRVDISDEKVETLN